MTTLDDTLAHFGIKGMKWGVRRSSTQGGSSSEDHDNAAAAKAKASKGGAKALSNKELQDLVTRINLEQQYSKLVPPSKSTVVLKKGGEIVGNILLGVGKQQASRIANDQATKLIASILKK